jgi:translocation and assembly module TamA
MSLLHRFIQPCLITPLCLLKNRSRGLIKYVFLLLPLLSALPAIAEEPLWFEVQTDNRYRTRFFISGNPLPAQQSKLRELLQKHLSIHEAMSNPRMNASEWQRLIQKTPQEISDLLATEGYFKTQTTLRRPDATQAEFHLMLPPAATVKQVNVSISGEVQQPAYQATLEAAQKSWPLPVNSIFTQAAWTSAKRDILAALLRDQFPNAKLTRSQALVDPATQAVMIEIAVDSGPAVKVGHVLIQGLQHYPESLLRPLITLKTGAPYRQEDLLTLQNSFMSTGKFRAVDVIAKTDQLNPDRSADIMVTVTELEQYSMRIGTGASTNTGARVVFNYTNRNLFDRGLLWDSSVRLEQRLQAVTSNITFLTDEQGYRDSIQNNLIRTAVEGQVTTAIQNGVRRYWGQPTSIEQFVGANLLYEFLTVDGENSQFNKAATVAYGFNMRRLNNALAPTKGWIFNTQFQLAPLDKLSDGRFLQSQARLQAFYPLTESTQWLGRIEVGSITGSGRVPATYLFRAGGDQSVRGYAFQSLGVKEADAIVGGRVLLTGSSEIVQWLTTSWGAAVFVDFGNAANSWKDYEPVLGYGLGARWRSPIGPVGVDIARGQETGEYRLHFNLGVNF